jgi:3-deoxy-D-manno-octulosonate 8-phosphate phosphatase (KDO 8-P phosphatase)
MSRLKPLVFILDVDGVLTSGHFFYSKDGKVFKCFGPDDHDALSLLRPHIEIRFVTGDKKGYEISKRRIVDDMKFSLDLVNSVRRIDWIQKRYKLESVIYMGDGIFDHYVMQNVGYSIAPFNGDENAKKFASFVTQRSGGDRAVAEAALHVLELFYDKYDPLKLPPNNLNLSGEWSV